MIPAKDVAHSGAQDNESLFVFLINLIRGIERQSLFLLFVIIDGTTVNIFDQKLVKNFRGSGNPEAS